jgi:UDP-N-acetylmuramyl pentapeptide phosphotransferase/UDP-N-acetylglucosamine-1-phosphate transferase
MSLNIMQWFDPFIFIFVGMSLALNVLLVYFWHKKFYRKLGLRSYKAIQRIHINETPRLGGFIFILSLVFFVAFSNTNESIQLLKVIIISLAPIIILGLKEDLFHNVEPTLRLLSIFFASWLFRAQFTGPFPNMADIPLIGMLLTLPGGVGLFYVLSMTAVANGMNLIDGVNGLCGAVALTILTALLFLSYKMNDEVMLSAVISVILIFFPFMILNYPYGKIFLGDLGAYSLGLILSMLTIILFGRHPEISPWGAVLILLYPAIEVSFSLLRRLINGTSLFKPDIAHLHLKLYHFFRPHQAYKKIANALVTLVLSILWIFPLLAILIVYQKQFFIWIAILLFIIIYGLFYAFVPSHKKIIKRKN